MAEIDTLPHNLEAERAVLGACLIRQEHVDTARAVLRDGDWYRDAHRLIWRSMLRIHDAGGAVDLVTVRDDLDTRGVLDAVGGPAYVSSLADGVPRSTNVQHYTAIVARCGAERQALIGLQNGAPAADVQAALERARRVSEPTKATARLVKASDIEPEHVDWLWRKRLAHGEVTTISGLPGAGKSLIAADVAANVTRGYPLPDDPETDREPGAVVWIGHASEDRPASVIVPRFMAAGGDPELLHVLDTGAQDVSLRAACEAAEAVDPVLVIIDSWAAWGADAATDSATEAAARYRVFDGLRAQGAAVFVITHDNKLGTGDDVRTVAGSMQTTAKPRTVLHVKASALQCLKGNLSGRADTLAFMVESTTVHLNRQTFGDVPRIAWDSVPMPAGSPTPGSDDSGASVDEIVEYVAGQPEPITANRIRTGVKMDSKRKRRTCDRLIQMAVDAGRLVAADAFVNGRRHDGFTAPIQSNRSQPVATGAGCSGEGQESNGASHKYSDAHCSLPLAPAAMETDEATGCLTGCHPKGYETMTERPLPLPVAGAALAAGDDDRMIPLTMPVPPGVDVDPLCMLWEWPTDEAPNETLKVRVYPGADPRDWTRWPSLVLETARGEPVVSLPLDTRLVAFAILSVVPDAWETWVSTLDDDRAAFMRNVGLALLAHAVRHPPEPNDDGKLSFCFDAAAA